MNDYSSPYQIIRNNKSPQGDGNTTLILLSSYAVAPLETTNPRKGTEIMVVVTSLTDCLLETTNPRKGTETFNAFVSLS